MGIARAGDRFCWVHVSALHESGRFGEAPAHGRRKGRHPRGTVGQATRCGPIHAYDPKAGGCAESGPPLAPVESAPSTPLRDRQKKLPYYL